MIEWEATLFSKKSHVWGDGKCNGWSMLRRSLCGLTESTSMIERSSGEVHCKTCTRILKKNKEKRTCRQARRKWNATNKVKTHAHMVTRGAVRNGTLIKPSTCSECGEETIIHGHHDDYSKLMDVRWLCQSCHFLWHSENGAGLNA